MKKIVSILLILIPLNVFSQKTLHIDTCIELSIKNHPKYKNLVINREISDLSIMNNRSNYMPGLNLEGKASYQSDVFSLAIDLPPQLGIELDLPNPPLDQYNFALNINQLIYDGGLTRNLNTTEEKKFLLEQKKIDIELYQLKEQVEKTYFSILILQKTEEQFRLTLKELNLKKNTVKSVVLNGVLTQDNYDILQAEIYKLEQSLIEIAENKNAGIRILEELMSTSMNSEIILILPEDIDIISDSIEINRPENELFALQIDFLDANEKLLNAKRLPTLGAFAQGGYGNPGLTMINDVWSPYFIIGAKLTWDIWDKNKTKRNKEILKLNSDLTQTNEDSFNKSISIQTETVIAEINKIEKMIEKDDEIIKLQKSICKKAEAKLNNGTITSTDYIALVNNKSRSIINSEIHKIKLIKAKRDYLRITGN